MSKNKRGNEVISVDDNATLLTGKPYTVAAQTNILNTFRKMGWVPPSEERKGRKWLAAPTAN